MSIVIGSASIALSEQGATQSVVGHPIADLSQLGTSIIRSVLIDMTSEAAPPTVFGTKIIRPMDPAHAPADKSKSGVIANLELSRKPSTTRHLRH